MGGGNWVWVCEWLYFFFKEFCYIICYRVSTLVRVVVGVSGSGLCRYYTTSG